jgi:hypothetical protein
VGDVDVLQETDARWKIRCGKPKWWGRGGFWGNWTGANDAMYGRNATLSCIANIRNERRKKVSDKRN